jgi:UPF0716 protein FxsA
MLAKLMLLFTVVPIVELALLLWVGSWLGAAPTIGLVLGTAVLGSFLAKRQGLAAWRQLQDDLAAGKLPQDALFDGMAVLIAATLLISPGVLSDISGILLMIPACRGPIKAYLKKRFTRSLGSGSTKFISFGSPFGGSSPGGRASGGSPFSASPFETAPRFDDGEVIDVTPSDSERRNADRTQMD